MASLFEATGRKKGEAEPLGAHHRKTNYSLTGFSMEAPSKPTAWLAWGRKVLVVEAYDIIVILEQ